MEYCKFRDFNHKNFFKQSLLSDFCINFAEKKQARTMSNDNANVRHNKVLLIYTGGTIGMGRNPQADVLEPLNFEHLIANLPEFAYLKTVIGTYHFTPHIDSSDMSFFKDKSMNTLQISLFYTQTKKNNLTNKKIQKPYCMYSIVKQLFISHDRGI